MSVRKPQLEDLLKIWTHFLGILLRMGIRMDIPSIVWVIISEIIAFLKNCDGNENNAIQIYQPSVLRLQLCVL